ncbi:Sec-independent protein translocase subunit TatA [Georgenia wangjunii]|uniref:Sec-independent protein translocase subunit TatA n=1 Tax=Georgenia wangjunii TaxID=3117730 RepID=UPI002F260E79
MRLQFWHILVLLLVVLILFGAKRLPDVASSVGKSLKIFKKEVTELREDDRPAAPTVVDPLADPTATRADDAARTGYGPPPGGYTGYAPPGTTPPGVTDPSHNGPADPAPRR